MIENKELLIPPNISLRLAPEFLEKVFQETLSHDSETGGHIYGLRHQEGNITEFIPMLSFTPKATEEIKRQKDECTIGGLTCKQYLEWVYLHWEKARKNFLRREPTQESYYENCEFGFLGTWHSHPGEMPFYSLTDTAWVNESLDYYADYLFPILVKRRPQPRIHPQSAQFTIDHRTIIEGLFFYRTQANKKFSYFLKPTEYSLPLPQIPAAPWYVEAPALFNQEYDALVASGFSIIPFPLFIPDNETEAQIWLQVTHPQLPHPLFIRTPSDYHLTHHLFLARKDPREDLQLQINSHLKPHPFKSITEFITNYAY